MVRIHGYGEDHELDRHDDAKFCDFLGGRLGQKQRRRGDSRQIWVGQDECEGPRNAWKPAITVRGPLAPGYSLHDTDYLELNKQRRP